MVDVSPEGKVVPNATFGGPPIHVKNPPDFGHVISADGSRVYWTDLADHALYLRQNPAQPQSPVTSAGTGSASLGAGSAQTSSLRVLQGTGTTSLGAGTGDLTAGSKTVASLITASGEGDFNEGATKIGILVSGYNGTPITGTFLKGQRLSGNCIPSGTVIEKVTEEAAGEFIYLTLSKPTTCALPKIRGLMSEVFAEGPAPFAVGQQISAPGIEPGTTITAVAPGSLTLSQAATETAAAVALSATSTEITSLHTKVDGVFHVGQSISGPGIPSGTTIVSVSPTAIGLSAAVTASGFGVPLFTEGPEPFEVGQPISGAGIPAGTTIVAASPGSLTLSAPATASAEGVALEAGGQCTDAADACTIEVDATQGGSGAGGGGRFWDATPDGSAVFFTDEHRLTPDSTAAPGASDLYEYQVEGGRLSDLTADPSEAADVKGVIGASADGRSVYFVATGALSGANRAGAAPAEGQPNLYLLTTGSSPVFIATLSPEDGQSIPVHTGGPHGTVDNEFGDWASGLGYRTAQVTGDGRGVVFMSNQSLSVVGYPHGYPNRGLEEVYMYEAASDSLYCVSCGSSGEAPPPLVSNGTGGKQNSNVSAAELNIAAYLPTDLSATYGMQFVSEDGNQVFFNSLEPLVPQDTNGAQDVYEWEREGFGSCRHGEGATGACLYLLSGGTSPWYSWFVGASASGDDAFVVTRAQLLPEDGTETFNLYDARVDGVRRVAAPACTGTGCQGPPAPPPTFATPPSVTFAGVGNFPPSAAKLLVPAKKKTLTRAQKLAAALRVCRAKGSRRVRVSCEARARKRYRPVSKAKSRKLASKGGK